MTATALGISCLARVFSALLPPDNDKDEDFYDILELPRNASQEDVRKAYKKKSLHLHPDKIAQRGGDPEAAAKQYELVQEAHGVLANPKKRRLYHALGCNATKYKFIASGAHHNPTALYENLGQASCAAKSRIVLLVAALLFLILLQPLLIVVKINHDLENDGGALQDTPWTVILIPWWISHGTFVGLWLLILCMASEQKFIVFLQLMEQVSWLTWEVLLAVRWDNTIDWEYVYVFIPAYVVICFRILQPLVAMKRIRQDCNKMISVQYLEQHVLDQGRRYEDLSEEEQVQLQQEYILVHNNDNVQMDEDVFTDEDDLEEARVHSSPEFHHAMDAYYSAFSKLVNTILFAPAFCILTVLRLDDHISVSWWVVFVPIWVHLGWRVVSNCWLCCCGSVAGEEIIIGGVNMPNVNDENEKEQADGADKKDRNLESSTAFAPAEGDFHHNESEKNSNVVEAKEGKEEPAKQSTTTESTSNESASKGVDPPGSTLDDVVELYSPKSPDSEPKSSEANEETKENADNTNVGQEEFHIDPETFQEWQSAYQEAEASAMEAQAKAQGDCLLVSLELTMLCLLVGKIDKAYETVPGDDVGYNAVWIIFPVLLLAGLALCCCACLIYGAGRVDIPEGMVGDYDDSDIRTEEPAAATAQEDGNKTTGEQDETKPTPTEEPSKVDEEAGGGFDVDDID